MTAINAALMIKALDALSVRATVTAQNIANAGTPGYRPLRLSFEDALGQAAGRGEAAIRAFHPTITHGSGSATSPDMRLDLELATASATTLRYSALVDLLGRSLQLQSMAITGNS